jgi:hypothetical protein
VTELTPVEPVKDEPVGKLGSMLSKLSTARRLEEMMLALVAPVDPTKIH